MLNRETVESRRLSLWLATLYNIFYGYVICIVKYLPILFAFHVAVNCVQLMKLVVWLVCMCLYEVRTHCTLCITYNYITLCITYNLMFNRCDDETTVKTPLMDIKKSAEVADDPG